MGNTHTKLGAIGRWAGARLVMLSRLYLALVAGWALAYFLFGDRWWWLFAFSSVAICLFIPMPMILAIGLAARRRDLLVASGAFLLLGAYLYGATLLPRPRPANAAGTTITVMSFNMLGYNQHPEAVVAAIRASGADVIGIQELSESAAKAIRRDLAQIYPYQALDPRPSVFGMGTISRYPLRPADTPLPGRWLGSPQVLTLDVGGAPITLANIHAIPLLGGPDLNQVVRERETEARILADFAAGSGTLIVTGDFNTTDLSEAHRIVTGSLVDSWREAGQGFGGTFPSPRLDTDSLPFLAGIPTPTWITRIDYVFYTRDIVALSSRIGPWDGYSDHRPVIATLALGSRD